MKRDYKFFDGYLFSAKMMKLKNLVNLILINQMIEIFDIREV